MAGFYNDSNGQEIVFCDNVNFSGTINLPGQITTYCQLLIGSTASPHIKPGFLLAGSGISITNSSGSILFTNTGGGGGCGLTTINSASGAATQSGGVITMIGTTGITTSGGGSTVTISPANDLAALEALSTTGFSARTGSETWALRTFQAGSGISITNPAGIAGDPTFMVSAIVPTLFTEDSGTATPSSNNLNILGATAAAGTTPVSTAGLSATVTIKVQKSQAIVAADATKIGLSNFNSSHFTVDANGFVSATGQIPIQFTTNSGTATPSAGNINILGSSTAAGTSPVNTSGSGSTVTVNVQKSQAIAATDATKVGSANFDSASFSVDANGFVTASTTGVLKTLTGNSGGAISPTANNINTLGTGSITIAGSGSTLTTQLTGLTNPAVLFGAGTATITNVGPTSTTGQVLQSAGASADPAFSTATYPSTTTVSQILYSSSTNTVTGLAT